MNDFEWKACDVRLDQVESLPDKQDALCLLQVFDRMDIFKQGSLTKRQLSNASESPQSTEGVAAASKRFVASFDQVSHQIEPREFPLANSIAGTFYTKESRVLSKPDLLKLVEVGWK